MSKSLEEVIRENIRLPSRTNSRGWFSVLCKVCNDHGKKGPRAGFRFDDDSVGYNCFNCGHTALFNPHEHRSMPQAMRTVLTAFGINEEEYQPILFELMKNNDVYFKETKKQERSLEPSPIELPDYFDSLETASKSNEWAQAAIDYLRVERGIDYHDYPFYVASHYFKDDPISKLWYGRLIIPFFRKGQVVFYQGRDLSGISNRKYRSLNIERENILYGYEFIDQDSDEPLYVTEGFFDAFMIKGVAVLGRKMSELQIKWLNRSRRPKVIIPDRYGEGYDLALQAISLGWKVSTPDIGDCKDVNDAVVRYGLLYTLMSIKQHTNEGFAAETNVGIYCKK